jgi:hypothetical protein
VIDAGRKDGFNRVYLELTPKLKRTTTYRYYDLLTYNENYISRELREKLRVLSNSSDLETIDVNDYFGTVLKIKIDKIQKENYSIPTFLYLENFGLAENVEDYEADFIVYEIANHDEEVFTELPDFVQRQIRSSEDFNDDLQNGDQDA